MVVEHLPSLESANNLSSHLNDYISYYKSLDAPGYAVLVTGEWGTGKTHQVKQCIPEAERYYVSLFGLQTVEQLHAEVYAVASPRIAKAKAALNKVSEGVAGVGGPFALANLTPSVFNAVFKQELKTDRTLIFDDLERSNLALKDVLGAINGYVEQQGFRVVVITHDEKMAEEFLQWKEKTFGQTIRVEPQVKEAMNSDLAGIKNIEAKHFLAKHREVILGVFESSNLKSLRILRHVIEDIERLFSCLSDKHLTNPDAMLELVGLFSALDIEIRNSTLDAKALRNRRGITSGHLIRFQTHNQ